MPFEEIAFEAEVNREEDSEAEDDAHNLCDEEPRTRMMRIEELRRIICERREYTQNRMDDAYLLRFLRARRFVPVRAHRLLVRYTTFRKENPYLWRDVDWLGLTKVGNILGGVLYDRPDVGRLIICKLGLWNPDVLPIEDLLRACLLLLEIGIMQPKLQILGGTTVLDCEGISMKHMRQFTPGTALHVMNVMGLAFPVQQRGVHIINCTRLFEALFHLFRKVAPADELWKRVHFHGYNLNSLHRYIDPECLPTEYGGPRQSISLELWLNKISKYANKDFYNEMRNLGYSVD